MKEEIEGGWSSRVKARADRFGVCLCNVEELPPWHFQHRGIKNGYRYCRDFTSALISDFYWHNETINIWSHIIASAGILAYFLANYKVIMEVEHDSWLDRPLIVVVILLGNIFPLLTSAFCHNFYCINKSVHKFCWFMDFCGILTGMLICGLGFVYFSFYCAKQLVVLWSLVMVVLYVAAIWWCWTKYTKRLDAAELTPRDRFPEFSFSLSTFVAFASFIPIAASWLVQPEYFSHLSFFWLLVDATVCPVLLSIGVVAFAQGGIPERWFRPNMFDLLGHSHQLWHLITATVMFFLASNIVSYFHARVEHGCGV